MSQIIKSISSVPIPPTIPTSFVTNSGTAVPAANILNDVGGSSTLNNNNGIRTTGSGNTVTTSLTNRITGSGTTVGAVTADIATFSLGATPGAYNFELKIIAYTTTGPAASGFTILGTMRTSGISATLVSTPDETPVEDISLIACDVDMIASGNNLIVRVLGVAGLTINWRLLATYIFVS